MDEKRTDLNASHRGHPGEGAGAVGQHVGLERLTAYCEGRLTAAERQDLQEHLSLCARCTGLLRELHEFASDSGQRGLSGPERLEQEAWESLVQRRQRSARKAPAIRPIAATERPMSRFRFVQHFFTEVSAGLLLGVLRFLKGRQRVKPLRHVVADTAYHPYLVVSQGREISPASVFLRGEGVVNTVRIPVQEGFFTAALKLAEHPVVSEYRFELLDRNGKVLCSRQKPGESVLGNAIISLYIAEYRPGFYRLRIEGQDANRRELLAEYLLEVEDPNVPPR